MKPWKYRIESHSMPPPFRWRVFDWSWTDYGGFYGLTLQLCGWQHSWHVVPRHWP